MRTLQRWRDGREVSPMGRASWERWKSANGEIWNAATAEAEREGV
jgi:hypothetical protein